jgi:hypothetical protein
MLAFLTEAYEKARGKRKQRVAMAFGRHTGEPLQRWNEERGNYDRYDPGTGAVNGVIKMNGYPR